MLDCYAVTDKGRVRSNNEDYCRVLPEAGLYLLADGMGGANGGERASHLAVETVVNSLKAAPSKDASTLLKAVEEANERVLEESNSDPRLEGMGTTLVAALEIGDGELAIASVGDSRAYVFEGEQLRPVTEDQTWVQEVGRPLGLDEESLRSHPMRHVLTMAIGVAPMLNIRYYVIELKPETIVMLSSDGLHGVIESSEIEEILRENGPENSTLEQKCYHLIEAARRAGGPDNITAVLMRLAQPSPAS